MFFFNVSSKTHLLLIWYDMIELIPVVMVVGLLLSLHWFGKKSVYGCWFSCTYSACSKRVASSSFTCTTCVLHALSLCVFVCFLVMFFLLPLKWTNFQSVLKYQHCILTTSKGLYSFVSVSILHFFAPSDPFFSAWLMHLEFLHLQILSYILLLLALFWWLFRCLGDCFES